MIRAVKFLPDYESKLQNKQLLRQESKLEEALTKQAEEDQKVQTQKRQIAAAVLAKERDWEKRFRSSDRHSGGNRHDLVKPSSTTAKPDLRAMQRDILIAEGDLAIEKSKALRDDLRNQALDTTGAKILLALEAVKNLEIPEVILNSDDPSVPECFSI